MASEWITVPFSQLCDIKRGASPRPIQDWVASAGIPWIKISDANAAPGRYIHQTRECIKESGRSKSVTVYPGDLILSNSATPGIPKFLGIEACIHDGWLLLRNFRGLDKRFAYYLLLTQRDALVGQGNGSVFTNLKTEILKNHQVTIPALAEQSRIAEFLGTVDERLELLQQTNATLEAIAQALFKSWFVDFDPVRAKAEGREPEGMDADTAALFPSELEDSELGPIPKGWRTESFEREFDFTMGQSPPGSTYNQDGVGVPFFQGSTDFGDVFPAERVFCTEPTRFARAGDLLMSVRAPVGALNIANIECSIGRGLCAIRHKSGSTGFTQQSVQACLARIENAAGEGALFKSLSKKQLAELPVVVANSPVVDAMISLLEPLAARQIMGARQAQRLAQLRDTLLPRLISGKLRLPEAEREVEAATA